MTEQEVIALTKDFEMSDTTPLTTLDSEGSSSEESSINPCIDSKLFNCTIKNTRKFTFEGINTYAKIVKVYDGDSVTAVFKYYDTYFKFNVRMYGYDSPEMRTVNKVEKKYAILSRDYLRSLILSKIVYLKCLGSDKYGRILGDVYLLNDENIVDMSRNIKDYMISNGWSYAYDGGTKKSDLLKQLEMCEKESTDKIEM